MPRLRSHRTPSLMLAAALVACSINPATAQLRPLPIREELRIGGVAADFTKVLWLAVGRTGTMIVAQPMDGNLRVYDAAGRPLKTLGRSGGGPREFGAVGMSGWTGDSLWVHDASLARISYVRSDATLGEPRPTPAPPSATVPKGMAALMGGGPPAALYPDGSTLFRISAPAPEDAKGNFGRREAYWFVDPRGAARQIVLGQVGETCSVIYEGGAIFKPFCRETLLRESPDGMRLAAVDQINDSTVEVAMMRRDGAVTWKRRVTLTPMPMTSAAWDSIIATRVRPTTPPAVRNAWGALKAPSRFPLVRTVVVGRDGSLWLEGWGKNVRPWTALRPDGSVLGAVNLTGRAKLAVADVKQIWTIELDQDDLPSIVRYRLGS